MLSKANLIKLYIESTMVFTFEFPSQIYLHCFHRHHTVPKKCYTETSQ